MTLVNMKFSMCLRILGLDHYRFPYSCQAFAYIASRNMPFDPIHLFSRALLNSHWFCHYNENHFFHVCLIIKYFMHSLWQAFQNMRLCISIQLVSKIWHACHFDFHTHINKLHLGIRINSSSLIHIPIYMTTIAC